MMLLAVSGGRDSVAMTDILFRQGCSFAIAHCNFHLRPVDCDRDQRFVQRLAERYGVPFYANDFDTRAFAAEKGLSVEEAARLLRYRYFARLCRDHHFSCVATAHHRDDSIETFFLNLFRGTGIAGLHGIRPRSVSRWEVDGDEYSVEVVRPLLGYSRAEIDDYVTRHGLEYVEDCTNSQLDARRNRIRLQLMPLLRRLYPSVDTTMQANIDRLYDTELIYRSYIDTLVDTLVEPYIPLLPTLQNSRHLAGTTPVQIAVSRIRQLFDSHPLWVESTRRTVLFELLRPYGFNADTAASVLRSLDRPSGLQFHSTSHTLELHRGRMIIVADTPPVPPVLTVEEVELPPAGCRPVDDNSIFIASDNIRLPLAVRPWREGDRFRPFGMRGTRLVGDFLRDAGLPLVERKYIYVVVDADDLPLWLVGLRPDERIRITEDTQRVVRLMVSG